MAKTLTVYLAADLKKFNQGMRSADQTVGGFGDGLSKKLKPALIAAGAAAGAFATKLAIDGVKAAIEDEKAVALLSQTLQNLGFDEALPSIEAFVAQMELATGVVDTELRAAFDRLIRSTKDVSQAQTALQLAVDISAAKGKSLEQVTEALGKAFDGQSTSLQRLGTGISDATLKSGDMVAITTELQGLFAGSAQRSASTYEGQLQRLTIASDNLKEAFGTGLLKALGDTNDTTSGLMQNLADLQPIMERIGRHVGTLGADTVYLASALADLASEFSLLDSLLGDNEAGLNILSGTISITAQSVRILKGEVDGFTGSTINAERAVRDLTSATDVLAYGTGIGTTAQRNNNFEIIAANKLYRDAAVNANRLKIETENLTTTTTNYGSSASSATDASDKLIASFDAQTEKVSGLVSELDQHTQKLADWNRQIDDYVGNISTSILSNISLGDAYLGQFDSEGQRTGQSLLDGFQAQLNEADWFGNVLLELKARGASDRLLEALAGEGPTIGGALGQQIIDGDSALLATLDQKLLDVTNKAREVGDAMVPEFLKTGQLAAIETIKGLTEEISVEEKTLRKLGKAIGKPIGANIKAEIARAVADAIREAEAAGAAARAEVAAREAARQARQTEQAAAQSLSRIIRNSDARAGRITDPVLG